MVRERVFTAGMDGYATHRIPALYVTAGGTALLFCESRTEASDWAPSALRVKRRERGGAWSAGSDLAVSALGPAHNACPLPSAAGGEAFHVLYCLHYARAFIATSPDGGLTFSPPREITRAFDGFPLGGDWTCLAIGPGGGIRTRAGRLIAPVWAARGEGRAHRPSRAGCLLSDDDGVTWRLGGCVSDELVNASEAQIAELEGGRLIMTVRNEGALNRRAMAYSADGGESWGAVAYAAELIEPVCQGSILRLSDGRLVTTAPQGTVPARGVSFRREFVTAFLSGDGGRTWPRRKLLVPEEGSGYTALAEDGRGRVLCAVECFPHGRFGEMSMDVLSFAAEEIGGD